MIFMLNQSFNRNTLQVMGALYIIFKFGIKQTNHLTGYVGTL